MNWEELAKIHTGTTHLERITWPYDHYPDMPQLTAGAEITLLDADGPGVVTNIHSSAMYYLCDVLGYEGPREPDAYVRVLVEITYDRHEKPDILMPLCDFLGDPAGGCRYYSTLLFSKVRDSHNFRLPMPFREHLRIRILNPTRTDLISYTDLQWEKLDKLPEDVGCLMTDYRKGAITIPEETAEICNISGCGTVKAQWLSVGTDLKEAADGEYVCEGNHLVYVDGEETPSLEYLGVEDMYGFSWGLHADTGDDCAAVIRADHPTETRTEISMLRCRTQDTINFHTGLRIGLDYTQEYFAKDSVNPLHQQGVFAPRKRVSSRMDWKSCIYYYVK